MWLTIWKYLLGPVGTIIGAVAAVGFLWLWINAKADLRSANREIVTLNDSIHGGEPGYPISQPGYVVRLSALQTAFNTEHGNTTRLQSALEMQNTEVERWKAAADARQAALTAAQAGIRARAREAANLSQQIAALKPSVDAATFAKQSVDALVGGLQ